jgi:hypothetical protein
MIAETPASMCPPLRKPNACRWAEDDARIWHLVAEQFALIGAAT